MRVAAVLQIVGLAIGSTVFANEPPPEVASLEAAYKEDSFSPYAQVEPRGNRHIPNPARQSASPGVPRTRVWPASRPHLDRWNTDGFNHRCARRWPVLRQFRPDNQRDGWHVRICLVHLLGWPAGGAELLQRVSYRWSTLYLAVSVRSPHRRGDDARFFDLVRSSRWS